MRTKSTPKPKASPMGGYDPFNDSDDSDSTDSSGAQGSPEDSVSSSIPGEPLVPEDDPMDGTTTCTGPDEATGPGVSLQSSKALESSSTGEGISEESVACENMLLTTEKEAKDEDKNDKASALFHKAAEKSMEFAEFEGSGRDLSPTEDEGGVCTTLNISDVDDRAQQIMKMNTADTLSMSIDETTNPAGGPSVALANSSAPSAYGRKEKMKDESEVYNPTVDSSASSSSSSPDASEIRKSYVSTADSTQHQLLEVRKILERNPLATVGEPSVTTVKRNVVGNPETRPKINEKSNKNDDGVSCDPLSKPESSDVRLTAGPEGGVSKFSKVRQKLGRATGEGLAGRANVPKESDVPTSESTSACSDKPQATVASNEETNTEENTQFIEVKKDEGQSNITQQLNGVGITSRQSQNLRAAKESAGAMPSCETVKATGEKTLGSEGGRVSRFHAKLLKKKEEGGFPAVTKKMNLVNSGLAQNVQVPARLSSLKYSARQTESNIQENTLKPDQGTVNVDIAPTLLSESQMIRRSSVDQISYLRAENSEKSNITQPLSLEMNALNEPPAHTEATEQTKIGPGHASKVFDTGVRQRLKSVKLKQIHEHDLEVLIEYCNGWFEGKSNLQIEQVPRESRDNAGRAFKVLKNYVDSVEAVFDQHTCLPQGQYSQCVTPLRHGISKNAPLDFIEIIESRGEEFANEYEKRNKDIMKQEDEVMRALIGTAGDYFEEEAALEMKTNYYEAQPLALLFSPIVDRTRQSFLNACDIKVTMWQRKYVEILEEEIQRRKNKIQSDNEGQRLKTQREIEETVERCVKEYAQEIEDKLRNTRNLRLSQQTHLAAKQKVIRKLGNELGKRWLFCPGLHDPAKKKLEDSIEARYKKECEKLEKQGPTQSNSSGSKSMAAGGITYAQKASQNIDRSGSGRATGKGTSKPIAFTDLPSHTLTIHMGLSRTRVGMFRPGTTEFQNIAEVENCLYYRDDSFLVAYNDSDKLKLNPQDVNFEEILIQGPIDGKHEIKLNEERYEVRKEHIISTFFAVLKWKAELELQVKLQNCVIVLPQFLNDAQRSCVRDAARIAGFNDVKLIDDTVAIALEYMMRKKERDRYFIVICALEGVIDVAKFHITDGLLRHLEVSGTHFLRSERANKSGWGLRSIISFFTWSSEEKEDILKKIFSNNELNLGKDRLDGTLKLFAGDAEMLSSIKTVMNGAKHFEQVSELNAVKGGALFAALCEESENCPLYKGWKSMRHYIWGNLTTLYDFKQNILSVQEKERKRSSNPSEGVPMSVAAVDFERKEGHLRLVRDVHDVVLEAVKIIRSIEVVVSRNQIRNPSSSEVLLQQLAEHKSSLKPPNLRMDEAKKIHDDLMHIWRENVLGSSGSY